MSTPINLQAVKPRRSGKAGKVLLEILAVFLVLLVLSPFIVVLFNASKTYDQITLSPAALPSDLTNLWINIKTVFTDPANDLFAAFIDSLVITAVSLIVIIFFSAMAAWVLVRNRSQFSKFSFMLFVAAMVIPFQVVMYPLVAIFKEIGNFIGFRLLGSIPGITFAYLGFGSSLSIFIFHGFIKGVPLALEESATIDGCSQPGIFFKIVLPLLIPTVMTVGILNGIWIWNDYLLPLLVIDGSAVETIPLAVTAFAGAYVKKWNLLMTTSLLAMLPIIIMFLFAQKYIIKGMVDGAIK